MPDPHNNMPNIEGEPVQNTISVLYVDDEMDLLKMGKTFLERFHEFRVDTMTSAGEAMRSSQTPLYDVIVSDYQMPGMDGIAFLKAVREQFGDIPFILFTGRGREEVVIEAINNGADFYLQKGGEPISQFAELSHKIKQAVRRQQAEKSLRVSEERFRGMAERSSDLLIIIDQDQKITYASLSARSIIGYDPEELVGTSIEFAAQNIFSQSVPEFLNVLQKLREGESIQNLEIRMRKKDGTPIYVNLYAVPIFHGGVFTGAQSSWRVITDDTTIKKALRQSEERFRQLVEQASEIVYILTREGIYSYISPRVTGLLGYETREVIGKHAMMFIHPDDYPRLREIFIKSVTRGEVTDGIEYRVFHKNGTLRWLSENYSHIRDDEGNIVAIQGICHDITDQKKAEDALRESEHNLRINQQRLDTAMDLANLVNWEYDVINDYFILNDRFYALYGTTAEREGGYRMTAEQYAMKFLHPDDRSMVADVGKQSIETTDPDFTLRMEHRIIRRDGEIRNILIRLGITKDADGRTIWSHGANQDVTEYKRTEGALRKANRQLNLLSSITRHDILNEVSLGLLYLDDAEMKCSDPEITDRLRKTVSSIIAIQTQIEFTRVYEELGSHEPQWIQLDTILPRSSLPESISLMADVEGISIFADPMLNKVFFDMLDNSLRHGHHLTEIRLSSQEINGDLIVVWEDNGGGIDEEEKEKIFERGYGKHTGLGMFLIREILTLTGISIIENGIPGTGARFEMTVPGGMSRRKASH